MSHRDPPDPLDELGQRLFRAARADAPTAKSRKRLQRALGAGLAAAAGLGVSQAGAAQGAAMKTSAAALAGKAAGTGLSASFGLFVKVVAIGVAGSAALVAVHRMRNTDEPVALTAERRFHERPRKATTSIVPDTRARALVQSPREPRSEVPAPRASGPARANAGNQKLVTMPSLSEEIAVLDRAREALVAGNSPQALRYLDEYRARFGAGRLRSDAAALRIEALARQGDRQAAVDLGRKFIGANPNDPLVDRVTRILVSLGSAGAAESREAKSAPAKARDAGVRD